MILLCAIMGASAITFGQSKKETSMFPEAKEGYERVEIFLPEKKNEDDLKIEFVVGTDAKVDKCNHFFIMGELSAHTVNGWGYTYYQYDSNGDIAGTLMGCPDNSSDTKFVTGQSELIRYNSKLPIVVYVPKGMKVKYKIWEVSSKDWQ